jgi:hypothetical protein
MCFYLNIPDDQLAGMAVAGMLPAIQEKLFGMEFDDLGQMSHRLSLMSNQAYGFKKDSRFVKHNDKMKFTINSSKGQIKEVSMMMKRK